VSRVLLSALSTFCYLNLVLCFFNLLPIPPLDGSRVVQRFLHGQARVWYNNLERYGMLIVVALIWGLPLILSFDPLSLYFRYTAGLVHAILTGMPLLGF
jgi:Zn-dependent protease